MRSMHGFFLLDGLLAKKRRHRPTNKKDLFANNSITNVCRRRRNRRMTRGSVPEERFLRDLIGSSGSDSVCTSSDFTNFFLFPSSFASDVGRSLFLLLLVVDGGGDDGHGGIKGVRGNDYGDKALSEISPIVLTDC